MAAYDGSEVRYDCSEVFTKKKKKMKKTPFSEKFHQPLMPIFNKSLPLQP